MDAIERSTALAAACACLFGGTLLCAGTVVHDNSNLEFSQTPNTYFPVGPDFVLFADPDTLYVTASPGDNNAGTASGEGFELRVEYFVTSSSHTVLDFFEPQFPNPNTLEFALTSTTASTPSHGFPTQLPVLYVPGDIVDAGDFSPRIPGTYAGTIATYSEANGRIPYMADEVILGWRYEESGGGLRYGWVRLTWFDNIPFERVSGGFVQVDTYQPTAWGYAETPDEPAAVTLPCPADLDANGVLNVDDVDAFAGAFVGSDLLADIDGNGILNVDDVDAFVAAFAAGC